MFVHIWTGHHIGSYMFPSLIVSPCCFCLLHQNNIEPCPECGHLKQTFVLCGFCYAKVSKETALIRQQIRETEGGPLRAPPMETVVLYEGETASEKDSGKRVVERLRKRPAWFSNWCRRCWGFLVGVWRVSERLFGGFFHKHVSCKESTVNTEHVTSFSCVSASPDWTGSSIWIRQIENKSFIKKSHCLDLLFCIIWMKIINCLLFHNKKLIITTAFVDNHLIISFSNGSNDFV